METPKILPKGTTQEQWDRYERESKEHIIYCRGVMKAINILQWLLEQDIPVNNLLYRMKSEHDKILFMDAPDEPGYYRANND